MTPEPWTVGWAIAVWVVLFVALVAFEIVTLIYNRRHPGKRANLSAYIEAYFQVGDRRLRWHAGKAVLIALFFMMLLHFLGIWG